MTNEVVPRSMDNAKRRKIAAIRSCVCPGTGFALVGKNSFAIATFSVSICILPAAAWVAFDPNAVSFSILVATLAIATLLCLAEQLIIKTSALHAHPRPSILDRRFIGASCVMWLTTAAALGLLLTSFGTLKMSGTGMLPTLEKDELLLYHKYPDWRSLKPDAVIVYRNAKESGWGQPGGLVVSRILAVPGDEISTQNEKYHINGKPGPTVAESGKHDVVLDVPASPSSLRVPPNCYFIVQDSPSNSYDSRVLSWARAENILSSHLWYISGRGFCKQVE